jgi:DNA-directed RNA polymerase subunit RPC12/RpoP
MSLTMIDYTCQRCGAQFQHRSEGKRKYRFCTQHCGNLARRKVTAEMLLPYADGGVCSNRIATELKISLAAVLPALRRFGLYRRWCERRYKKCAPLTAGVPSMIIPSETGTGLSAKSEALTA